MAGAGPDLRCDRDRGGDPGARWLFRRVYLSTAGPALLMQRRALIAARHLPANQGKAGQDPARRLKDSLLLFCQAMR
jgi:hypothetical protein